MLDPALGAGALLDMGIYPLTFAHLLLGEAEELRATADLSAGGIDLDVAITGRYAGGALATMTASMTSWSSRAAAIATDLGRIDGPARSTTRRTPCSRRRRRPGRRARAIEGAEPVIGRGYGTRDRRGRALPARRAAREPAGAARRRR